MSEPAAGASPLAGRTALVTGASSGIGAAVARVLAQAGARVALLARREASLTQLAETIGEGAFFVVCDVADASALEAKLARVRDTLGDAPHIVINNAGAFEIASVETTSDALLDRALDVKLAAPFRVARAVIGAMRARGDGDIITIGSIADRHIYPENGAYSASKFGLRALHEVTREELRGSGVRATLISPGPVDTPTWDAIDPDHREGFTPRSRMLRAESVADAVLWCVTRPRDVDIDELRLSHS